MTDKYHQVLNLYIADNNLSGIFWFIPLLALLLFFVFKTATRKRKEKVIALAVLFFLMLIAVVVAHKVEYDMIKKDYIHENYTEYVGFFSYGERNANEYRISLSDDKTVKLRYDEFILMTVYGNTPFPNIGGQAYGKIVYSTNSKIVVFAEITEQ